MKVKPKDKPVDTDPVSDAVKMAANNYMLVQVTCGFWQGTGKLKQAAKKAALAAGANHKNTRLFVDLLGETNHKLLREVNAAYRLPRTYLDDQSLPYAPKQEGRDRRGKKMIHVNRVPEVLATLYKLINDAEQAFEVFAENYEVYRQEAVDSAFGSWRSEASRLFPSLRELRLKFHASVGMPEPIPAIDMERFGHIPADMLGRIVEQSNNAIARQLETAKHDAIEKSLVAAEKALKQLSTGERFAETVLTDVVREATKLQEIADSYDQDPRVQDIAKSMLTEVANVRSVAGWKNSETKKLEAKEAAEINVKNLRRMKEVPPLAPQPVSTTGDTLIIPDAISDLL